MKNTIQLNKEVSIDIPKLIEGGMVILANSGGGKSYAIRKIAEEACNQVQTIIIDPEGEFASLREKYDFILAGKNADVPVEVRSASLLAIKLLELGKSAVIDLYELHPQERQRYVKLFCDAMVNCPKDLYHPVIIILDEAHEYVPEGKPSEATWAVESLASKGRKRGQRLILASQRISKLSKNASAECNNKLIGRASQDIDMKRAGDELGFNKEKLVQLRQLKPGEFFAFGPAISDEVLKIKVGEVQTRHAKIGYNGIQKTPPASSVIKKVLGVLKDLPQEAEKEAKTIAEFKAEIKQLKTKLTQLPQKNVETDLKTIEKVIKETERKMNIAFMAERDEFIKHINNMFKILKTVAETVKDIKMPDLKYRTEQTKKYKEILSNPIQEKRFIERAATPNEIKEFKSNIEINNSSELTNPEKKILNAIAWLESIGIESPEQVAVAFLAGYSYGGGAFNNPRGSLRTKGMVEYVGNQIRITEIGRSLAEYPDNALTTEELHRKVLNILPGPESKILIPLLEAYPNALTNEELAIAAGYTVSGGAFNNPRGKLRTLGLIDYLPGGQVRAKGLLFLD